MLGKTPKTIYDKEFNKGKNIVVLRVLDETDLEICVESATEHGYSLFSTNSLVLGLITQLIFKKD